MRFLSGILLGLALTALSGNSVLSAAIHAGFCEKDITPSIGMEQPGGYSKVYHARFHDPCKVRASVFANGDQRIAVVGIDALLVTREWVEAVRKEIHERCGIKPESIMISASHSHSSGPMGMIQPGEFDQAEPLIQELAYERSSAADAGYLKQTHKACVDAVVLADQRKVPVKLGFGSGKEEQISFNRRLKMKNGLTYSHPGLNNPDIIDYAGPIDPDVGVIAVWDMEGRLIGTVVNFACHATTGSRGISANWIYELEQTIQGVYERNAVVVFLPGASGDVTQVDNKTPYVHPSNWSERVGRRVGAEAVKVITMMEPVTDVTLNARQKVWEIARRAPSQANVANAKQVWARDGVKTPDGIFAKETLLLDAKIKLSPKTEVEVQTLQLGPVVLVSTPAEYFVENGLWIKAHTGFPLTFPVSMTNGCVGYVPTEEAFRPDGGGYETRLTLYSNLEITAGTQMREIGVELARQFKAQMLPTLPPAPEFKAPWAYGNLGPQLD